MVILTVLERTDSSYPTINSTIQSAVSVVIVEIDDGIYHEYLAIDKPLILRGGRSCRLYVNCIAEETVEIAQLTVRDGGEVAERQIRSSE